MALERAGHKIHYLDSNTSSCRQVTTPPSVPMPMPIETQTPVASPIAAPATAPSEELEVAAVPEVTQASRPTTTRAGVDTSDCSTRADLICSIFRSCDVD